MSTGDRTLVLATTNSHKVHEIADVLAGAGLHLLSLADLPPVEECVEDAETFAGNARRKALHYSSNTGFCVLADDSGLCVDALDGGPGIYSSRFAGGAGDDANNELLLQKMSGVPEAERGGAFVCALCLARPDGTVVAEVEGRVEGRIAESTLGEEGFGYDPLFRPDGHRLTFGQLPPEIKRGISHRTNALRMLLPRLRIADFG